jgi:hypothetical protein
MAGAISACILRSLDHQHRPVPPVERPPNARNKSPSPSGRGRDPPRSGGRVREHASQPNPRPHPPLPQPKPPHHPPALTTANKTRSTRPTEASGTPATRSLPPPPPAEAYPAKHRRTIRRLIETTRVIAESAAVRELSSTGNTPRNPHIGNPSSSAATGKTARHSPGFIRCRLSTTARCTNHGCQISPLMPSQDGGSGPSQAPCQTFMIVSSVLSPIWTGGRI